MNITLRTNNSMPKIAYGTSLIQESKRVSLLQQVYDIGVRHFDTSTFAGSEPSIGEFISTSSVPRQELFITTKFWMTQARRIRQTCLKSLQNLKTDYIDLYMVHFPFALQRNGPTLDPTSQRPVLDYIPMYVIWKQMEKLYEEGLVKNIGVCNFPLASLHDLMTYAQVKPCVNQFESHIYYQKQSLVKYCQDHNIFPMCYKLIERVPEVRHPWVKLGESVLEEPIVIELAEKYQKSPAQILFNWNLKRGCGNIFMSTSQTRMQENWDSHNFEMGDEDFERLQQIPFKGSYCESSPLSGYDFQG